MVEKTLQRSLDKGQQCSNWDRWELTPKQIQVRSDTCPKIILCKTTKFNDDSYAHVKYAADDSVCALQIFAALMRKHGETKVLEKVQENIEESRNRPPRRERKRDEEESDLLANCPVRNRIKQKCEL